MKNSSHTKNKDGFTLIEIMVVFLIFIGMFDGIWLIYKNTVNYNSILTDNLNAQEEVRKAFISMTAGIRSALPSSIGSYPINNASSTHLTYYSDIDHDGLNEQVRYFLTGNTLKKGIIKPAGNPLVYSAGNEIITEIIHNLVLDDSKPIFSYYDNTYDGTNSAMPNPPNILNIRLIKINVLIDRDPSKPPAPIEFSTQVSIRNLKG